MCKKVSHRALLTSLAVALCSAACCSPSATLAPTSPPVAHVLTATPATPTAEATKTEVPTPEPTPTREPTATATPKPPPTAVPTKEATPVPIARGVEVVDNFEGADMWAADPARLKQAQDRVFKEKFGKTSGIVTALLPVSNIDNPDYHNVQVRLDLSKGTKAAFYNAESLTAEEQMKYREGIPMYSQDGVVIKTRYSEDRGRLVLEIFCRKPIYKWTFSTLLVHGLLKFIDIGTDVTKIEGNRLHQDLILTAWGQLPPSMGGNMDLVDPFIGASL